MLSHLVRKCSSAWSTNNIREGVRVRQNQIATFEKSISSVKSNFKRVKRKIKLKSLESLIAQDYQNIKNSYHIFCRNPSTLKLYSNSRFKPKNKNPSMNIENRLRPTWSHWKGLMTRETPNSAYTSANSWFLAMSKSPRPRQYWGSTRNTCFNMLLVFFNS